MEIIPTEIQEHSKFNYLNNQPHQKTDPNQLIKIGFWKRTVAIFIDFILLDILTEISLLPLKMNIDFEDIDIIDLLAGMNTLQAKRFLLYMILFLFTSIIFSLIYFTYFHGSTGQTIGKKLLKIKVIQVNGEPLDYKTAFIRWVGYFISEIGMFIGFIWAALDKNKQGWHDKIAGTYVVKAI